MQMISVELEDARRIRAAILAVRRHTRDDSLAQMDDLMRVAESCGTVDSATYLRVARVLIFVLADRSGQPECARLLIDLTRITVKVQDLLDDAGITAKLAYAVADEPDDFNECNKVLVSDMFYWHHRGAFFELLEAGKIRECIDYLSNNMHLFARGRWYPFHSILSPAADFHREETLEILRGLKGRGELPTEAESIIERVMRRKYPGEQG